MIKTILVPASGSSTDDAVFSTALAFARPVDAHLNFYHVRLSSGEAAAQAPHVDYCVGSGLSEALAHIKNEEGLLAATAANHFKTFCKGNGIPFSSVPGRANAVTASWDEETYQPASRLLFQARHNDLIVIGRPRHRDYLPPGMIEQLLIHSGRPIVVAPANGPTEAIETAVIGWKETPEAARALAVALPILTRARRVLLVGVSERDNDMPQSLSHLASQLAWHGIVAESRAVSGNARNPSAVLAQTAADVRADLLIIGGFGHGTTRELVFGGVTQDLIERADLPVFIMH